METKTTVVLSAKVKIYSDFLETSLIKNCPNIVILGKAKNTEELLDLLTNSSPDAIVLSLDIASFSKVGDLFGIVKQMCPKSRIIIDSETYYFDCIKKYYSLRGAHGYTHANCYGENHAHIINTILSKNSKTMISCDHSFGKKYHHLSKPELSFRDIEYDVLALMVKLNSVLRISEKLGLKVSEVKKIRGEIIYKLLPGSRRVPFHLYCLENGLVSISHDPKKVPLHKKLVT